MSEKVYLVTGSELANFSKEKITLALNWVISTAGDHPELSVVELASLLKENVNTAIGDNEEWVWCHRCPRNSCRVRITYC